MFNFSQTPQQLTEFVKLQILITIEYSSVKFTVFTCSYSTRNRSKRGTCAITSTFFDIFLLEDELLGTSNDFVASPIDWHNFPEPIRAINDQPFKSMSGKLFSSG